MTTDNFIIYTILIGSIIVFGGAAVWAFSWAMSSGQFDNFERGSRSIFDADEPVGRATDFFPDTPAQKIDSVEKQRPDGSHAAPSPDGMRLV